jgi:hypothetical protein
MTTHDDNFAKKLTGYLDRGTADLKVGTAYRLQKARAAAISRLAAPDGHHAPEPRLTPALAGTGSGPSGERNRWTNARLWLGIAIIVAAGFGYQQWQVYQQTNELEELDAQILTSDLPIDAYLDQGFRNWLAHDEN